jgi:hypothetical protein
MKIQTPDKDDIYPNQKFVDWPISIMYFSSQTSPCGVGNRHSHLVRMTVGLNKLCLVYFLKFRLVSLGKPRYQGGQEAIFPVTTYLSTVVEIGDEPRHHVNTSLLAEIFPLDRVNNRKYWIWVGA